MWTVMRMQQWQKVPLVLLTLCGEEKKIVLMQQGGQKVPLVLLTLWGEEKKT